MLKNTTNTNAGKRVILCGSLPAAGPGRLVKVKGEAHFLDSGFSSDLN